MVKNIPGGVWPVMVTPFTEHNEVDFDGLNELVEWYIKNKVDGLFAVCQSSEMFALTLKERVKIAEKVKEYVADRVPVIASGHVSDNMEDQKKELCAMAETGIDALVLITNRMAKKEESDDAWICNMEKLLKVIPETVKLGLYECPYPYKRVLTEKLMQWCVDTGKFYFLKDTSCDMNSIKMKLRISTNSNLKIYNANTATLLESLKAGAYGYSGVMANMHPELYRFLFDQYKDRDMVELEEFLTLCSWVEGHCYPMNAKYYLQQEQLKIGLHCRTKKEEEFTETYRKEVLMVRHLTNLVKEKWGA